MSTSTPTISRGAGGKHRLLLVGSFIVAQAITLFVLMGPLLGSKTPWSAGFRNYFANDQLSYLAIAVNTSHGISPWVEPLTESGVSFYPSLWYAVLGLVSGITGVSTWTMWTILGVGTVCLIIGVIGTVAYFFAQRAWAPVVPALMLVTGTFSEWTSDYWYSSLNSHAVIWGPFGTLFTLNAESIGVLLNAVSISLIFLFIRKPRVLLGSAIAVLLGVTANIQTYSFFTGAVFAALFITVIGVMYGKSTRRLPIVSAVLFIGVLLLGNVVSNAVGPLPLLVLLLATLIPANIPLIRSFPLYSGLFIALYVVALSPQIVHTLTGLFNEDSFLLYRQASTLELGISPLSALISAIPLGAISLVAFLVAIRLRNKVFVSFYVASAIGILVMSTNDLWGFNQEPYRMWLQFTIVIAVAGSIPISWALAQIMTRREASPALLGLLIASIIVWLISLTDFAGFYRYAATQGVISFADSRAQALAELAPSSGGLILPSRCEDAAVFKAVTGRPTADYNLGLAWPTNRDSLDRILLGGGQVTADQLRAAGIEFVVEDSACLNEWVIDSNQKTVISGGGYSGGILTFIRIPEA
jgi:hypothetical protein